MKSLKRKGNVLLVNPWIVDFAAYDFWIKPLGLLSIGSVLKENAYDIHLLDCMDRSHPLLLRFMDWSCPKSKPNGTGRFYKEIIEKPKLLKNIPRRFGRYGIPITLIIDELKRTSPPDVVLVTSGMTYWYPGVVEMVSAIRQNFPGVPIILGGIYASLMPEHARRTCGVDEVVAGEGEQACLRIVDDITGSHSDVERYQNFENLPDPAYDLYPNLESAAILTSRGCPYQCPFCASSILSGGYRRRSPLAVVEEIERIHKIQGVHHFAFYDDALLYKKDEHLVPILEELINRNLPIHFHTPNGIQPKEIDERLACLMHKAGFQTIRLSYESADKKRQKSMGLKVRDDDLLRAVSLLLDAGFQRRQLGSYVLMGLPGQSIQEVVDSTMFVLGLGIRVNLASFSPIPGTACWEEAVESGFMAVGVATSKQPSVTTQGGTALPAEEAHRIGAPR